jgi:hypothetical protein
MATTLTDFVLDMLSMLESSNLPDDTTRYLDENDFENFEHLAEAASDLFTRDDDTPDFERMDEWTRSYGYLVSPESSPQLGSYVVSLTTKKGRVTFTIPHLRSNAINVR